MAERHGRTVGAQTQVAHDLLAVSPAYQVQPLLHLVLVVEASFRSRAFGGKEHIEVELVELPSLGHGTYGIGQLVGHHHQAGQRAVGIVLALSPFGLLALLVAVSPVVNLLLNELSAADGAERSARKVEVGPGGDGQAVLVEVLQPTALSRLLFATVLVLKEVLGRVAPSAVVIFVEDDAVPVH